MIPLIDYPHRQANSYDYIRLDFVLTCIRDENPGDPLADIVSNFKATE